MNKVKQLILVEIRKLKAKAEQKRREAEKLETEAIKLQEDIDKL